LQANRTLTKLDLSGNHCFGQKDKTAVESLAAVFAGSTTISELNLAGAGIDPDDAKILAPAIKAMGSLSKLTWSGENYNNYDGNGKQQAPPVTLDTTMIEADLSNKHLGLSGATILAAFISTKNMQDKGQLSKLDISGNQICGLSENGSGTYDASGLTALTKSIGNLKELNITNNFLKAEGAKILVPALEANGSLSKLTFSGDSPLSKPVTVEVGMTEADFSGSSLQQSGAMILAAWLKHKVQHDLD
jgi:Ran GTPase-activating protein (RanGAP) involved in mRNA processing and transport